MKTMELLRLQSLLEQLHQFPLLSKGFDYNQKQSSDSTSITKNFPQDNNK